MAKSQLRVKEICLPSSANVKTVRLTSFQKDTIAIHFNALQVGPSVYPFVFAVLFIQL